MLVIIKPQLYGVSYVVRYNPDVKWAYMLAVKRRIVRPVVSYVIEKMTRTLHRVGSVSLAVALAIALTLVGLAGPVAAQPDDPDDKDDPAESIEALNTMSDEN